MLDPSDPGVEVGDGVNVAFRRNPNKPPEVESSESQSLNDIADNQAIEPKSDDETEFPPSHLTGPSSPATERDNVSQRQPLRRTSTESDVSLLSRDSDDALLVP